MNTTEDAFEAYAKEQEKKAAESNSVGGYQSNYEEIRWSGLQTGQMKLIRAVGGPPNSELDEFTAKTTRVSWIVGDSGKKFRCILPDRGDHPDHIMWRIIARVKATEWVDRKKVYPVQVSYPEIFRIVQSNGISEGDKSFIFERGWEGRQVLIMNMIDREQMDWHRENNHTMLLSRNIGLGKDGREYPEEGVPSYGFESHLGNLFKFYKSWEKYDIGITRTGLKESPYRIINATKYIEEVPENMKDLVSGDPITEEELNFERYDLSKIFGVTSYTKIFNRLKATISRIDATLGTHFLRELEEEVGKEKARWDEENKNSPVVTPSEDVRAEVDTPVPTRAVRPTPEVKAEATSEEAFDTSLLKGWDQMAQPEKDGITGLEVGNDGIVSMIHYKDPEASLLACPSCTLPAPDTYTVCPSCGIAFV